MTDQDPKSENYWDKEFVKVVPSFDDDQAILKGAMTQIMDQFKKEAFEVNAKNFHMVAHAHFRCKVNTYQVYIVFTLKSMCRIQCSTRLFSFSCVSCT